MLRAATRNLSFGGVFIDSPITFSRDTRLKLRLALPGEVQPLELGGIVRWTRPGSFGVCFSGLRFRDVCALERYLEAL